MRQPSLLTLNDIALRAPSILATQPVPGASDKYSFVPTTAAIEMIMGAGWKPYSAYQSHVRKDYKRGFQRHVINFTMGQEVTAVGDEIFSLMLSNSHDRGSAFQLSMGVYRLVCSNGLIIGSDKFNFSHKHIGFDSTAFLADVKEVVTHTAEISHKVDNFKEIGMTPSEIGVYAAAASQLISDEPETINQADITRPRRWEDKVDNLWMVYNRTQENVMRGGVRRHGMKKTRNIKNIDRSTKLNKALWVLTEKMAELKSAA